MKATELQCYDLINVDGRETRRVYGMMADSDRIYDEWQNDISANRCNPIPLTAEILEKNGWVDCDETLCRSKYVFIYGENGSLTLNHWTHFYTILCASGNREIRYVHELQHALRLCGLTELADNFKID